MTDKETLRILIVDDHAMVRDGMRNFIYSFDWMEAIGEVDNGREAVEFCTNHEVDVVLMDIMLTTYCMQMIAVS